MAKMLFLGSLSLTCILFFMPCNKLRQSCLLWYSYRAQAKCSKAVCDGCYVDEGNTNAMLTYTNGYMHATVSYPAAFIHSVRQGVPWIKLFLQQRDRFWLPGPGYTRSLLPFSSTIRELNLLRSPCS